MQELFMPFSYANTNFRHRRLTVYQLRATVNASGDLDNALHAVADLVLSYIAKYLYVKLPSEATEYRSFELDSERGRCECVSVEERRLWTAQFRFMTKNNLCWFYDVAMIEENGRLLFGIKIEISTEIPLEEAQAQLPLVTELLSRISLAQFRPISASSWKINDPAEIENLYALITSPYRNLPVIVISQVNWNHWTLTPNPPGFLVNDDYLARQVAGYAHIVRLSFQAAFAWTKRVGKPWAVYDGACRTYFQNVNIEKGIPAGHPGNRKDKIWYWAYNGDRGPNAYTSFLTHIVHHRASTNRTDWRGLYFVPDARILAAELELAHSTHLANAPAREAALNHHVAALQRKLDAAEEENADWLAEVEQAREIAEFYRNENISLRRQIDVLRNHLKRQRGDKELDTDVPIPRGYDAMPDWVRQHLAGRLILHPRAERAVGKAEYVEPEMVYRALLILANEYRNSRMGIGSDESFRTALAKYGMDFSGSIDKARAGQEGDAYFVNYPPGSNNRRMLQFHIERGNSREPRYCMRIYFFWDEESNQVVVGWLPGHLSNRIS